MTQLCLSQCMTSQWYNHSDHCCNHSDHLITIGHQQQPIVSSSFINPLDTNCKINSQLSNETRHIFHHINEYTFCILYTDIIYYGMTKSHFRFTCYFQLSQILSDKILWIVHKIHELMLLVCVRYLWEVHICYLYLNLPNQATLVLNIKTGYIYFRLT